MRHQEEKRERSNSTVSPVFSNGKGYTHLHSLQETSMNLRPLTGTEGIRPSASPLQSTQKHTVRSQSNSNKKNKKTEMLKSFFSPLSQERLMGFNYMELHPQLRFIAAPTKLVPFQQFSIVLEITDVLGGTLSALRLIEGIRSRQQEKYTILPEELRDGFPLPPVDLVLTTELCNYGMQSDEYLMDTNLNNRDSHFETVPLIIKCPSPFSNMRYSDGGSLSSAITAHTLAPPLSTISGILSDPHMDGLAISRISNSINMQTEWDAFALSEPCIAAYPPQSTQCGVQFRVCCQTRTVVALLYTSSRYGGSFPIENSSSSSSSSNGSSSTISSSNDSDDDDDNNNNYNDDRNTPSLVFPYALHIDPDPDSEFITVRLRECGRTIARRLAQPGDIFALRLLPDGRCLYLHNGHVCYRSSFRSDEATVYRVLLRVAYQETIPAVDAFVLLPSVAGLPRLEVSSLLCKPPWPKELSCIERGSGCTCLTATKREIITEAQEEEEVILRAWLRGYPVGTALHTIIDTTSTVSGNVSFPTWAIAAFSLLSSFALGAVGCCNDDDITAKLREFHRRAPIFLQQQNFPKYPLIYVGVCLSDFPLHPLVATSIAQYPLLRCIIAAAQFARGELCFYETYAELTACDVAGASTTPLRIDYDALLHFRVVRQQQLMRIELPSWIVRRWAEANGFAAELEGGGCSLREREAEAPCALLQQLRPADMSHFLRCVAPLVAASRRGRSASRVSVTEPLPLTYYPPSPEANGAVEENSNEHPDEDSERDSEQHPSCSYHSSSSSSSSSSNNNTQRIEEEEEEEEEEEDTAVSPLNGSSTSQHGIRRRGKAKRTQDTGTMDHHHTATSTTTTVDVNKNKKKDSNDHEERQEYEEGGKEEEEQKEDDRLSHCLELLGATVESPGMHLVRAQTTQESALLAYVSAQKKHGVCTTIASSEAAASSALLLGDIVRSRRANNNTATTNTTNTNTAAAGAVVRKRPPHISSEAMELEPPKRVKNDMIPLAPQPQPQRQEEEQQQKEKKKEKEQEEEAAKSLLSSLSSHTDDSHGDAAEAARVTTPKPTTGRGRRGRGRGITVAEKNKNANATTLQEKKPHTGAAYNFADITTAPEAAAHLPITPEAATKILVELNNMLPAMQRRTRRPPAKKSTTTQRNNTHGKEKEKKKKRGKTTTKEMANNNDKDDEEEKSHVNITATVGMAESVSAPPAPPLQQLQQEEEQLKAKDERTPVLPSAPPSAATATVLLNASTSLTTPLLDTRPFYQSRQEALQQEATSSSSQCIQKPHHRVRNSSSHHCKDKQEMKSSPHAAGEKQTVMTTEMTTPKMQQPFISDPNIKLTSLPTSLRANTPLTFLPDASVANAAAAGGGGIGTESPDPGCCDQCGSKYNHNAFFYAAAAAAATTAAMAGGGGSELRTNRWRRVVRELDSLTVHLTRARTCGEELRGLFLLMLEDAEV